MNLPSIRRVLRESIERLTGTRIYRTLPQGIDVFADLRRLLPSYVAEVVFDVGANVGQSTKQFLRCCPNADVYCFEPVSTSFAHLRENFADHPNVHCFQLALGNATGNAKMTIHELSVLNALCLDEAANDQRPEHIEDVAVETLTSFCHDQCIEHIDFLKIDTEGQDLAVLEGAVKMLDESRIGIVQVEAGMNPKNERHVPLSAFVEFLQPRGYRLLGLYEQVHEWPSQSPVLRRANPVFLSEEIANLAQPGNKVHQSLRSSHFD